MNTQATSPGCPELDNISAYFDGELEADETVRAHLASCPDCSKRLADYETIRRNVSRALASEPDPGMNARIAAYIRAENAKLPPVAAAGRRDASDSRAAWIFRIAALIVLSAFFVYLLTDQIRTNHARRDRIAVTDPSRPTTDPPRNTSTPVLGGIPGAGDYVRARLVSNTPSLLQYAIDVDPMLMPGNFEEMIPGEGMVAIPLPSIPGVGADTPRRIPLRGTTVPDAMRMLESIRRDLTALDLPGVTVDLENRGNSLFTTIRLDTDLRLDMNAMQVDGMFQFILLRYEPDEDDACVAFQLEFFCE